MIYEADKYPDQRIANHWKGGSYACQYILNACFELLASNIVDYVMGETLKVPTCMGLSEGGEWWRSGEGYRLALGVSVFSRGGCEGWAPEDEGRIEFLTSRNVIRISFHLHV
jgi:hypothetical protein